MLTLNTRPFDVDDHTVVADLVRLAAKELSLDEKGPPHGWLLATVDGAAFTQNAFDERRTIEELLRCTTTRALELIPQALCMHGSPGVPGKGFLCGWC